MSKSCVAVSWSVLDRQQAELDTRIREEKRKGKALLEKMVEHQARLERLEATRELSRQRSLAKTEEEFDQQDKEIGERIDREGLSLDERSDLAAVEAAERDMDAFLQGSLSVGVLPADFVLGSSFTA